MMIETRKCARSDCPNEIIDRKTTSLYCSRRCCGMVHDRMRAKTSKRQEYNSRKWRELAEIAKQQGRENSKRYYYEKRRKIYPLGRSCMFCNENIDHRHPNATICGAEQCSQTQVRVNSAKSNDRKFRGSVRERFCTEVVANNCGLPPANCENPFCMETSPVYDHDHTSGKFRGWLCHRCNAGVGIIGESSEKLRWLAIYAEMHKNS
jgi:hypothetical protein